MIKVILILLGGYILGIIYSYRKNRKQCVNCGGYRTKLLATGMGGVKGSQCKFAVTQWEGHHCKDCDKIMSTITTL